MANEDISKLKIEKSTTNIRFARKKKRLYWIVAIIIIGVVTSVVFREALTLPIPVEVANISKVYPSQTFTLLNASGYVVAQRKAAVASKVTGRLVSLTVDEGTRVKAGEIIARLENEDVDAARNQAEANLKVAGFNREEANAELQDALLSFSRNKELLARGYISRSENDSAEARYRKAKAAVEAAEAIISASKAALKGAGVAMGYTLLRAPFDAVVLTKNADIGDIVTPLGAAANAKAAVVTIADMNSLEVEADVSESNLQLVKAGQPCEIQLDALPDKRFRGEVHTVVPTADRSKGTVMVKIRFIDKDRRIVPEMSAKVAFLSRQVKSDEHTPLIAVNPEAIIERNGGKVAYVIKNDRVIEARITAGQRLGDMIEILSGVKPGDKVVLRPSLKLKSGSKIKIEEK